MNEQIIKADPLTAEEREQLILAFLRSRGRKGARPDEIAEVVEWAHNARVDHALLDLVLGDVIDLDMDEQGVLTFRVRD